MSPVILHSYLRSVQYDLHNDPFEDSPVVGGLNLSQQGADSLNESTLNLCKICFGNEPDAIFMDCGHGGVCYECSLDVWRTTEQCYLCRKEIQQVLQVDVNNRNSKGFFKVVACTQVEEDSEDEEPEGSYYYNIENREAGNDPVNADVRQG